MSMYDKTHYNIVKKKWYKESPPKKNDIYLLLIYLTVLGLSCSMWNLVPCPGIKPWAPFIGSMES